MLTLQNKTNHLRFIRSFCTIAKETEPCALTQLFKQKSTSSHNIYRHSQHILSILTTMNNRCLNMESDNPIIAHDRLTPSIVSKFVPNIYKKKDLIGRFGGIGSYVEPYRTLYIDQLLKSFLFNSDSSTNGNNSYHVIEIGIGFDFRIERILGFMLDSDQEIKEINLNLYELDLPNVLDVRDVLMNEFSQNGNFCEDHSKINIERSSWRNSIFDRKWIQKLKEEIVKKNGMNFDNVIFITEALFLCISQIEMENVIRRLSEHFKGATFVFDTKTSKEFANENEGKMFETMNQCALLSQNQIKKNVPMFPRIACSVMSRDTFTVTRIKFL